MSRRPAIVVTVLLILATATTAGADPTSGAPVHLLETPSAKSQHGFIIGATHMPVLNPFEAEHGFDLPADADFSALLFSIGLKESTESGTVRFEVLLEPELVSLFRRELSEPGWVDVRVDLPAGESTGRRLLFRKSLVDGTVGRFILSAFADPVLLPRELRKRVSIVLLSIDTLRADFVGAYGRAAARTPALDRLAREGTLYENAYSPSTWTVPSHAALIRGLYPAELPGGSRPSAAEHLPLAARLRAAGYRTAAFTGGGYLSGMYSLQSGFGSYFTFEQPGAVSGGCSVDRFDGEEVFGRATRWLESNAQLPFFLFVHTYDAHDRCPVVSADQLYRMRGGWKPGKDGRRKVEAYYETLIAGVDKRVGALLGEIDRLGLADSTLVVVTSDHGEAFWEHGVFGHGCEKKPYRELTRVPLILRLPGHVPAGKRVREPVSLVDLVPTVLDLAGFPLSAALSERSLPMLAESKVAPRPVFVHCGELLAVQSGRYRLLTSRTGEFPDEVYDVEKDPGERQNRAGKDPELDAALRRLAALYWGRVDPDDPETAPRLEGIDEKTRERLRALGYIE